MRYISLADLSQGESGTIIALHEQHQRQKSWIPCWFSKPLDGTWIFTWPYCKIERRGKWGGPLQVYIGTTAIILRPSEARAIEVTPL